MVTRHESYSGQIVWIHAKKGKVLGKIIKVNRVNIKVQDEAGLTYTADPMYLSNTSTEDAALWSPTGTAAAGSTTHLTMGQIVKFKSGRSGLYVVLGAHSGAYRVAKLGGDKGRYIRGVLPTSVEVVTFDLAGV